MVDGRPDEVSFNQPSELSLAMNYLLVVGAQAGAIRALTLTVEPQVMTQP
ncbi:MAG: hypothetical protein KF832_11020 [Caldilineaceae bacterium]|nr:hypothetical protein [Caldilineaceae bacterium]